MKKKTLIMSLVLTLALVLGGFQTVFADTEVVDPTSFSVPKTVNKAELGTDEAKLDAFVNNFYSDVKAGKYKLVSTEKLGSWIKSGKSMVIVDTMPASFWADHHIPGSIGSECGDNVPGSGNGDFTPEQKKALLKAVKAQCKTKNKKGKTVINYKKTVVIYCGFVGCKRSHEGAKYLASKGFKNVYRYAGGASAWQDAAIADPENYQFVKDVPAA